MLNKIILQGRLGRNPEKRALPSGKSVATFSLAVDRDFKSKETGERETDWVDIVCFGNLADMVSQWFSKGRMAVVSGRLQIRSWTDKDGNKRRTAEVVADNVYFGDSKHDADTTGNSGYQAPATNFDELTDDDPELPF